MNHSEANHTVKISVIIVNYNVKYYVEQCLFSLKRALNGEQSEIFVVDNASKDGSVTYLKERFPEINIIESNHNLGFARANNLAIKQSKGQYILLLNPDTIISENTIAEILAFMTSKADIGGVGLRMITHNGNDAKESRRGIPTPLTAFYKMSGLCAKYPNHKTFARYYMGNLPWNEPAKIDVVSGAFFAVPRKALEKTGLLDEAFFMYGEDIDLSYRLLKNGFQNYYYPNRILHYKGESTQKNSFRYVHVFYKAMLIFFKKHFGGIGLLCSLPIQLAIYTKAILVLVQMQTRFLKTTIGLYAKQSNTDMQYYCIGSNNMIENCKEILQRKGLRGTFIKAEDIDVNMGHNQISLPKQENICVVYDVSFYSFAQIFDFFSKNPQKNIYIGTYNPATKIIISTKEILK